MILLDLRYPIIIPKKDFLCDYDQVTHTIALINIIYSDFTTLDVFNHLYLDVLKMARFEGVLDSDSQVSDFKDTKF